MVEMFVVVMITALNVLLGVREEQLKKTEMSKKIGRFLTQCQCKWWSSIVNDFCSKLQLWFVSELPEKDISNVVVQCR